MRGSGGKRGCGWQGGMLCLLIHSSVSSSLSSRNSSLRSFLFPPLLFYSWTNERVCQVLIMKRDVRGESGQRGTVPWISCCALI